jgi:hypothetical protein
MRGESFRLVCRTWPKAGDSFGSHAQSASAPSLGNSYARAFAAWAVLSRIARDIVY